MKKKIPVWAKGVIILFIIAVLAAAIAVMYKIEPDSGEDKELKSTDVPQYNVYRKEADEVSEIRIMSAENTMRFKNTDGVWQVNGISPSETDPEKIDSLLVSVLTVISNHEIEKNPQDLSVYQLDDPMLRIEIDLNDGITDKFIVGSQSPVTKEYFYMREGGDTVYSIYEAKVSSMLNDEKYYQDFSRFSVNLENIDEIIMERKGKNKIHLKVKEDLSSAAASYNVWEITEPYDGVYNAIDQFVEDKIITQMSSLNISRVAEKRDDYGLDEPEFVLTVNYAALDENGKKTGIESTQNLKISKSYNSKRFVSMNGHDSIYEIDASSADFMAVDEFLVISKLAVLRDIATTSCVTVTYGNEKFVMDISHNGDEMEFKINGQEADTDEAKKKYQDIIGISADGIYNNEPFMGEPEIIIEFDGYNGTENTKAELIPIDDLSYAINRDGKAMFTVKKADVNDMIEKLN